MIIRRKLLSEAVMLSINLNDAQAATLYKFLLRLPIQEREVYLQQLRQTMVERMHKKFLEPELITEPEFF